MVSFTRMLGGFTSVWRKPISWRKHKAKHTWFVVVRTCGGVGTRSSKRHFKDLPINSYTRLTFRWGLTGPQKTSHNCTMCGCERQRSAM